MRDKPFVQPSVMDAQQHFSRVPSAHIDRSTFNRSHGYKTTFDAGKLVPFFIDEVVPGDTHQLNTTVFARLATPLKPVMDNITLDIHYFFVPMRLIWDDFQKFMGERPDPDFDPSTLSIPQVDWPTNEYPYANPVMIGHYLGLPMKNQTEGSTTVKVSALPGRAVRLIWNEWYRDQNLQNPRAVNKSSIVDTSDLANYMDFCDWRCKQRDYFTSCLPWPQKGDPVQIPIGDEAVVMGFRAADTNNWTPFAAYGLQGSSLDSPVQIVGGTPAGSGGTPEYHVLNGLDWQDSSAEGLYLDPGKQVGVADLSTATSISINQLRTAFQVQKLMERDARGGTRYIELIYSHFGVVSSDARLQRPEFLGRGSTRVNVAPLASTVAVQGGTPIPQANLSGVGTAVNHAGFEKSFEEHGYIIGFINARADLTYQRCLERMWTRKTRYDFYWPVFAHLGEQAVLNQEIFYNGDPEVDQEVFGYQERFAEYRYKPSLITGLFNSDAAAPLDTWHLAQEFNGTPVLGENFILDQPPIDRVIAVPSEPHFIIDCWHQYISTRPMPVYSDPGLIDHF